MANDESAPVTLRACPFCGGEATAPEKYDKRFDYWQCGCDSCSYEGPCARSEAEAIAAWNTRAIDHVLADNATVRVAADTYWRHYHRAAAGADVGMYGCMRAAIAAISQLIGAGRP